MVCTITLGPIPPVNSPGVKIRAFPGDAESVSHLRMILLHSILSGFRGRAMR